MACLSLIRVVEVTIADGPPSVLQREHDTTVALNLLQMLGFMPNQPLDGLVARHDIDCAPELRPALEAARLHVNVNQAASRLDVSHAIASA